MEQGLTSFLSIDNLTIGYGEYPVLKQFNLQVSKGEIVTLFGPSGCGKSTILKTILGIHQPKSGTVQVEKQPASVYNQPIGYTPQTNELLPWKTVLQNVELWNKESAGRGNKTNGLAASDALALAELTEAAGKLPKQLSGGMERRTALARCMATHTELMLLDEVFVAMERRLSRKLMFHLRKHIKDRHITAVLVSHDWEEACFMSDRIIVLDGSPAMIKKQVLVDLPPQRSDSLFGTTVFEENFLKLL